MVYSMSIFAPFSSVAFGLVYAASAEAVMLSVSTAPVTGRVSIDGLPAGISVLPS